MIWFKRVDQLPLSEDANFYYPLLPLSFFFFEKKCIIINSSRKGIITKVTVRIQAKFGTTLKLADLTIRTTQPSCGRNSGFFRHHYLSQVNPVRS